MIHGFCIQNCSFKYANAILRTLSYPASLPSSKTNLLPSPSPPPPPDPWKLPISISLLGAEKRIVFYYTSLSMVHKTFENYRTIRSILKGFKVFIDERDLSMDAGLLEELNAILGSKELMLPRVFISGRYVGRAEEIQRLHETEELNRFVEGFLALETGVCNECGGHRLLLCDQCNGRKPRERMKA
ncbi:uncharacterized protein At5g39865-like [Macadamia integrifolia]|uniref:uncharacterized protein At5g39865-like n=1 Tax=Macadamia integrifolia TaxID=60698 RepID=UPI001C4FF620|nr:uncharacterized protein At5g39865-like [Macadamia integrifolia]